MLTTIRHTLPILAARQQAVWSPGAVMSPPHDIFTTRCTILPSVLRNNSYIHFKAPFKVHKSTNHWCILNSVLPDKVENTFAPAPDLSLTWRRVRTAAVTCLQQLHPAVWKLGTLAGGITGASWRQNWDKMLISTPTFFRSYWSFAKSFLRSVCVV